MEAAQQGKRQLPRLHLVMLARSRPAQLQVKPGSENKKGKVHSPAEDLLVANNMDKRAERKRAKRPPRLLALNNAA